MSYLNIIFNRGLMKKNLKYAVLCFMSACLIFPAGSAFAKTDFVIGVQNFSEYLPYSSYDKKTKDYTGFNRKILDMFAASKGYTFSYKALPIKRLYKEFLNGKVDLKYPDNKYWSANQKKGKNIQYSAPMVKYIDGVMIHPDRKGMGVDGLKKMGIVRGFTPFTYLKEIKSGKIKIIENNNIAGLLKQVDKKRVDGAYFNLAVTQYYLKKLPGVKVEFDSSLPHAKSTRHLSSYNYPKLIEEFNAFLKSNKGKVDALKEKYKVEVGISGY